VRWLQHRFNAWMLLGATRNGRNMPLLRSLRFLVFYSTKISLLTEL
jgi:hypothetical protein